MIQAYTNRSTPVIAGATLPIASKSYQKGCTAILANDEIQLTKNGVYSIDANFSFTPAVAGLFTISAVIDGVTSTVFVGSSESSAVTQTMNVSIPFLLPVCKQENCCCDANTTLSFIVNVAGNLETDLVKVTKIC